MNELKFTPSNHEDYLSNPLYHHKDKGCDTRLYKTNIGDSLVYNKECLTHNVNCSKTGWEMGWYGGTKSENGTHSFCVTCGTPIISSSRTSKYCPACKKLAINRIAKKCRLKRLEKTRINRFSC